jgi:hypothetical protein
MKWETRHNIDPDKGTMEWEEGKHRIGNLTLKLAYCTVHRVWEAHWKRDE